MHTLGISTKPVLPVIPHIRSAAPLPQTWIKKWSMIWETLIPSYIKSQIQVSTQMQLTKTFLFTSGDSYLIAFRTS